MTKEELILEAGKKLYEQGIIRGMRFALHAIKPSVKTAIRMGIESALTHYDASDEMVEKLYQNWLKDNPNAQ